MLYSCTFERKVESECLIGKGVEGNTFYFETEEEHLNSQESKSRGRNLNFGHPEEEAVVITTTP
jgi:hypothetical protein